MGILASFLVALLTSLTPTIIGGLSSSLDFFAMTTWCIFFATIFVGWYVAFTSRKKFVETIFRTSVTGWVVIFLMSALRLMFTLCFFYALSSAPRIEANILTMLWPIFYIVFDTLLGEKVVSFSEWLMIILSFVGVVIIAIPDNYSSGITFIHSGYLIAILASVLGGLYSFLYPRLQKFIAFDKGFDGQVHFILLRSFFSLIILIPFTIIDAETVFDVDSMEILGAALIGVLSYASAQVLYSYALLHTKSNEIATIQYVNPVLSAFFLHLFLNDAVNSNFLVGAAFILVANYAMQSNRVTSIIKSRLELNSR
jgi:drug/metabolite transporter (DMT)-like permease